jgi:hypothetical protein
MTVTSERYVQILVDLKSADPTALTALEAIRHLLGFEDRLASIRRRHLHELTVTVSLGRTEISGHTEQGALAGTAARKAPDLPGLLSVYLERTVAFWNPNKHRAWVRIASADGSDSWEALSGGRRRAGSFGVPGLESPEFDHVVLWSGEPALPASDLASGLSPWTICRYARSELYSLLWLEPDGTTASTAHRREWTGAVAAAKSRHEGLLVNPHYQQYRILEGAVPIPSGADSTD